MEFDQWVRRLQAKAREGHAYSRRQLELVAEQLKRLRSLSEPPIEETAGLRQVRQSKKHQVWRLSHRYEEASPSGSSAGFHQTPTRLWLPSSPARRPASAMPGMTASVTAPTS